MFEHCRRVFQELWIKRSLGLRDAIDFIVKSGASRIPSIAVILVLAQLGLISATAQVPSPEDVLGFRPTDDRKIADWNQILQYFKRLDARSKRVQVREIGKTTLGKPQIAAFISSRENIRRLDEIQRANRKIATGKSRIRKNNSDPRKVGKTIVAISCSIHSTEIVASQMSMNLAHELATANDPRSREIRENTVLILIPSANPDGIDIVADWYRKTLGTKYEGTSPPQLYHHYAGHDNNRDWFMMNLAETRNITKLFWKEWFPQIVYDVHQQGSTGSRMTIPPFFDPPNPRIPPTLLREIGLVGYKMAADMAASGEKGIATNATYDTWWHGGFRSAPYYHNSIGILSEAASASLMTPIEVTRDQLAKKSPTRGLKNPLETSTNFPEAWEGGLWGPKDIARLEMTAAYSLLELASKFKQRYLDLSARSAATNLRRASNGPDEPIAFYVPAGQPNGERVARFLEILMWQGIEVNELSTEILAAPEASEPSEFEEIPAGSFIILVNQIQKNNVLSLFEKQVYPLRINALGEAEVPYDVSGWTLPLQMGIEYGAVWNVKDFAAAQKSFKEIVDINEARNTLSLKPSNRPFDKLPNPLKTRPKIGLYRGSVGSMDEGWTRLVLDNHQINYDSVSDIDIRNARLDLDALILPSQSENQIVSGHSPERYPEEFTGGITETGVENLKKYVAGGGKLICFDDSCEMLIKRFELPLKNVLTGLTRKQFHCPGSILAIDVDTKHTVARGMREKMPAYFNYSSAYRIEDNEKVRPIASYAAKNLLLSGWIFGEEHINGQTAIAEADYGNGKIILFGFRPQHRGQTYATFPFVFNALEN